MISILSFKQVSSIAVRFAHEGSRHSERAHIVIVFGQPRVEARVMQICRVSGIALTVHTRGRRRPCHVRRSLPQGLALRRSLLAIVEAAISRRRVKGIRMRASRHGTTIESHLASHSNLFVPRVREEFHPSWLLLYKGLDALSSRVFSPWAPNMVSPYPKDGIITSSLLSSSFLQQGSG